MRLKETLTKQQMVDLLSGSTVGIFPYIVLSTDLFYNKLYDLCLGYYTARSAEKTISPTYERYIQFIKDNSEITKTPEELMGKLIRGKFLDKWNRVYDVLINSQYDALNNKEYSEIKTGNNQNKDTYNTTNAKEGSNTDTTTFNTKIDDVGSRGTSEVVTRSVETADDVYGFNSVEAVGDTKSNETVNETIVGDKDKNTSQNTQNKTGTESRDFGINESERKTGTDTRDITINEQTVKSGRDDSGAELITKELNLRNTQLFFDIIYADIDSITTLQIYI